MLVLTRKISEKIMIGKNVIVSVLAVEGQNVKIGIEAPKDVSILRMEVFEKIQSENIASASKALDEVSSVIDLIKNKLSKE